jgi:GTP-binding protein
MKTKLTKAHPEGPPKSHRQSKAKAASKSKSKSKGKAGQAVFIKSAVYPQDYPRPGKIEVALAGRSNSGKSSFINALVGSKIAKVSQVPGKTRLLNFFAVGDQYILVDMPGYGFAARSGKEMEEWSQMVEGYLTVRETLGGLLLTMDIRRKWDQEEKMLKEFCDRVGLPLIVILTKADKVSRAQGIQAVQLMKKANHLKSVFAVSNMDVFTVRLVEEFFYLAWVKKKSEVENGDKMDSGL